MKEVGEAVGLLGKLPPLDAEHVKAVGASMPGRLLGRTAALVAAFAALFATYAVVQGLLPGFISGLRQSYPPLVFDTVFFGLPLLIVAV